MATRAAKLALRGKALSDTGTEIGIVNNADATAITIDSSENVGIGVVPETDWYTGYHVIQLAEGAVVGGYVDNSVYLGSNWKDDANNKYINTDEASVYKQSAGRHIFQVAPSGSADAAMTMTNAMMIDNSGNLMVGQTSVNVANNGHSFGAGGNYAHHTSTESTALYLNRKTSDGDILRFRKDNTAVGSISVTSSGIGIALGGTGAANTLDDYEEGTWSPQLTGANNLSHRQGRYTKIGKQVHLEGEFRCTSYSNSGSTNVTITGAPFAVGNYSHYNVTGVIYPVNGFNQSNTLGYVLHAGSNSSVWSIVGLNQSAGVNYDYLHQSEMGSGIVEVFFTMHYSVS